MDRAGKTAERVKDAAVEAGREVKETVRAEVKERAPEIKEVVQQAGQQVKEQVKESAKRVKSEAKDAAKESGSSPEEHNMSLDSLQKLFLEELKDMYNAEKQILRALPRMIKATESARLQEAFTKHLKETEAQVQRLERIFTELGQPARGKACKGMEGILEEGKDVLEKEGEPAVIDAALIAAAQRVEHYEIAAYGCLRTYAQLLGLPQAEQLLQQTLQEEEAADKKLTEIGESGVNQAAASAGSGVRATG